MRLQRAMPVGNSDQPDSANDIAKMREVRFSDSSSPDCGAQWNRSLQGINSYLRVFHASGIITCDLARQTWKKMSI
jgi:hypothetical protein